MYEDNIGRCFVLAVNESAEQSQKIIAYLNRWSAGKVNQAEERRVRVFLQNCLRSPKPLEIVNPYAEHISLPEEAHKIRRLNELYQYFVRQVTLLNQHQRKRDRVRRLLTETADLRTASEVLFECIVLLAACHEELKLLDYAPATAKITGQSIHHLVETLRPLVPAR